MSHLTAATNHGMTPPILLYAVGAGESGTFLSSSGYSYLGLNITREKSQAIHIGVSVAMNKAKFVIAMFARNFWLVDTAIMNQLGAL